MEGTKSVFVCPYCGGALERRENGLVCEHGHLHNLAKEGYVHLLRCTRMHSKHPGDTKEMVESRRQFLDAGFYQPFSDALNDRVLRFLGERKDNPVILDAGCGEGYYTVRMMEAIKDGGLDAKIAGIDISKAAVRCAAKRAGRLFSHPSETGRDPDYEFAVASLFEIPLPDNRVTAVVSVFAPLAMEEFGRILCPGGYLILAVPEAGHLWELKQQLYKEPYRNAVYQSEYEGFEFVERTSVKKKISLQSKEIMDLFSMTPYYWKTPADSVERLRSLETLTTSIGFDFLVYRRSVLS